MGIMYAVATAVCANAVAAACMRQFCMHQLMGKILVVRFAI
jgi:hypothetical protein